MSDGAEDLAAMTKRGGGGCRGVTSPAAAVGSGCGGASERGFSGRWAGCHSGTGAPRVARNWGS